MTFPIVIKKESFKRKGHRVTVRKILKKNYNNIHNNRHKVVGEEGKT